MAAFFLVATVNTIFQNAFHRFAAEIAVDFADAINFEKCSRQNINNYRIIFLSIFPVICTTRSIAFRSSIFADDSCVGAASHTKRKHPHSDPSSCRWPKWLILLVVFFLSVMARALARITGTGRIGVVHSWAEGEQREIYKSGPERWHGSRYGRIRNEHNHRTLSLHDYNENLENECANCEL